MAQVNQLLGKKKKRNRNTLFISLMLLWPLLHFFVFTIYINVDTILLSMQKVDRYGNYYFCGLDNFISLFNDFYLDSSINVLNKAFVNSLLFFPVSNLVLLPCSIVVDTVGKIIGTITETISLNIPIPSNIPDSITS